MIIPWFLVAWYDSNCIGLASHFSNQVQVPLAADPCWSSVLRSFLAAWAPDLGQKAGIQTGLFAHLCAVASAVACEKVKTQGMFGPAFQAATLTWSFWVTLGSDSLLVFFKTISTVTWAHKVLCCVCTDESYQLKTSLQRSWIVPPPTLLRVCMIVYGCVCFCWNWLRLLASEKGPRRYLYDLLPLPHVVFSCSHMFMFSLPHWSSWPLPCTSKPYPRRGQYARVWIHWRQQRCLDEAQAGEPAQAHVSEHKMISYYYNMDICIYIIIYLSIHMDLIWYDQVI